MNVARIDDGLWRWSSDHPDWRPGASWDAEVASVYLEVPEAVVLVDPLVPTDPAQAERFLVHLDADIERLGLSVVVVVTVDWHRRSADALAARYPGGRIIGAGREGDPPDGVVLVPVPAAREVVVWIPGHRAVVPGDVLLGDGAGGVRRCPPDWLPEGSSDAELGRQLAPLLDLGAERVLLSHGAPVLEGGGAALRAALDG
ncbi:MAG: hypothetical protein IT200_13395 [Thermoleophilia bacterium]|nr:hypothetical protein [Thermoleophilia bacterium]